jgi:Double zinc ribbon
MSSCPRCQKPIDAQAISCPHCNLALKAFGHPGIPLHQSGDGMSLCDRCTYHVDDTCNFPQRPQAESCTLYHDATTPLVPPQDFPPRQLGWRGFKNWLYRYRGLIAIALLILISLMIAVGSS